MTERPILFSAPMVRAILAGTKTQTRRVVKWRGVDAGLNLQFSGLRAIQDRGGLWALESNTRTSRETRCDLTPCPYGQPGDRLWVRETWAPNEGTAGGHLYRADHGGAHGHHRIDLRTGVWTHSVSRWRPSIHMPRAASRITLEITNVRVERLQMIGVRDAIAEGIPAGGPENPDGIEVRDFRDLWLSINGAGSWEADPWVWIVEFQRVAQ